MKTFYFHYYASFGRGDYSDHIPCEVDLSDEEWARLEQFYEDNPEEEALSRPEFADIYRECYDAAIECEVTNGYDYSDDVRAYIAEHEENYDPEIWIITEDDIRQYLEDHLSISIVEDTPKGLM